ncbi:MAG TPA: hypothetical protein PLL69_08295, partial [Gemmatimonadales bacterium]|nr:hypothetical protein [Gemmatimonadales bacterium]
MRVSAIHASAALLLLPVAGCGSDTVTPDKPDDPVPASIAVHAGNQQQAAAGAAVAIAPAVIVRDADGDPVSGVSVTFSVTAGGGALQGGTSTTNSAGIAAVSSWVLGQSGAQTLTATVGSLPPVEIHAAITPGSQQFTGTIGAGGGTFQIDDPGGQYHGLKLTAPSGMYPAATEWRMRIGTLSPSFSAPAGFSVIGPPIEVETAALRGNKLMTLEVPVNA